VEGGASKQALLPTHKTNILLLFTTVVCSHLAANSIHQTHIVLQSTSQKQPSNDEIIMPSRTEPERPTTSRRGVYLLTHPRSASNLFQTMMSKQPNVESSGYKMFDASFKTLMSLDDGPLSQRSEEEQTEMYTPYRKAFVKMQQGLDAAESKVSPSYALVSAHEERREEVRSQHGFHCVAIACSKLTQRGRLRHKSDICASTDTPNRM